MSFGPMIYVMLFLGILAILQSLYVLFFGSSMGAAEVLEFGCPRVVLATGSRWRRDGVGRSNLEPIEGCPGPAVLAPEEVMAGAPVAGPVVIFDDEHYYMGGALAERLVGQGHEVTLVTTAAEPSVWTLWTDEHHLVVPRLHELGVKVLVSHHLRGFDGETACVAFAYGKFRAAPP